MRREEKEQRLFSLSSLRCQSYLDVGRWPSASVVGCRSSIIGRRCRNRSRSRSRNPSIPAPSPTTAWQYCHPQCRSAPASESNLSSSPRPSRQPWSNERGKPFLPVPRAPTPLALPRQPQLGVGHHRLRVPRLHSPRPLSSLLLLRRALRPLLSAVIPHPCLSSSLPLLTFLHHPRTLLQLVPLDRGRCFALVQPSSVFTLLPWFRPRLVWSLRERMK